MWYLLVAPLLGVIFVKWIGSDLDGDTLLKGLSVGILACGSYDTLNNIIPKLTTPKQPGL
jgi:hypothetical protein